jgi:hypothetical protein
MWFGSKTPKFDDDQVTFINIIAAEYIHGNIEVRTKIGAKK